VVVKNSMLKNIEIACGNGLKRRINDARRIALFCVKIAKITKIYIGMMGVILSILNEKMLSQMKKCSPKMEKM
jgi:hypothetical protein